MKNVRVRYGIGYGTHTMDLDVEDEATEEEIAEMVHDYVMKRVDYGFEVEDPA